MKFLKELKVTDRLTGYIIYSIFTVIFLIAVIFLLKTLDSNANNELSFRTLITKELNKENILKKNEFKLDKVNFRTMKISDRTNDQIIVGIGSLSSETQKYHLIALFDKNPQTILDILLSRNSFYSLNALTVIDGDATGEYSFVPSLTNCMDINDDGINELIFKLDSFWADATSQAPLVYSKDINNTWKIFTLPSVQETFRKNVSSKKRLSDAYKFFDQNFNLVDGKNTHQAYKINFRDLEIFEDTSTLHFNGVRKDFASLRNGGFYDITQHPETKQTQLVVCSFFSEKDPFPTSDNHHMLAQFLCFSPNELYPDPRWNLGSPMISIKPTEIGGEFKLENLEMAGIKADTAEGDSYRKGPN